MATRPLSGVLQHLRHILSQQEARGLTDGQLLERFLTHQDEAAFEALVRRHGPMVLAVCRRVLHNLHDAEDAFQATFLVLIRKAASIRPREMVGNWLYGVAYRTARRSQAGKSQASGKGEAGEPYAQRRSGRHAGARTSSGAGSGTGAATAEVPHRPGSVRSGGKNGARKWPTNSVGQKAPSPAAWHGPDSCWPNA